MYELVHRYAPDTPIYRAALAALFGVLGVLPTLVGLLEFAGQPAAGGFYFLIAVGLFAVSTQLLRGLARQAGAADTGPVADETTAESAVDRLRRRYADGEVSDEEFDRRLDRLLETEAVASGGRGSHDGDGRRSRTTNGRMVTNGRRTDGSATTDRTGTPTGQRADAGDADHTDRTHEEDDDREPAGR